MDSSSKEDISRALLENKNEIFKILKRYSLESQIIDTCEDVEKLFCSREKVIRTESRFECKRCNSHDITFRQIQIRSADEGETSRFKCNGCQHVWYE